MKVRVRADDLRLVLQYDTALDLCGLEIIERAERLIGDTVVGERPQVLDIRCNSGAWDEKREQVDAFGYDELFAGLPVCLIEDQQDALRRACANAIVNTSALTVGKSNHSVCPEAGCTQLERESHWKRCWTATRGREPLRTQTRHRIGLSPTRCD